MDISTLSLTGGVCISCRVLPVMHEEALVCRACFDAGIKEILEERKRGFNMGESNLLKETKKILKENKKDPRNDVRWVGSMDGSLALTWEEFELIAKETDYNPGYGAQEIACDLVVVGSDWWLERGEYDGSEWWEFKRMPVKKQGRPFMKVTRNPEGPYSGYSLKDFNKSWDKGESDED